MGVGAYKISGGSSGGFLEAFGALMDAASFISLMSGIQATLYQVFGSALGAQVAAMSAYINLVTTILAWSVACGDSAANVLLTFMALAASTFAFLIGQVTSFGYVGLAASVLITVGMQAIATKLSIDLAAEC